MDHQGHGPGSGVVKIEAIKPASTVERTGALSVGDVILGIDGFSLRNRSLVEARKHLALSSGKPTSLEVLPVGVTKRRMMEERNGDRNGFRHFASRRGDEDNDGEVRNCTRGYPDQFEIRQNNHSNYSEPSRFIESSNPLPPPIPPPVLDDAAQRQLEILSRLTQSLSSQIQVDPLAAALQSLGVVAALNGGDSLGRDKY